MTRTALAKAAGVSTRSLTKYEREGLEPTPQIIARLATAVSFPMSFFYGDTLDEPSTEYSSFRSLSTLTARQRDQALTSGSLAYALSDWISERFDLPPVDVPSYPGIDPETAAQAVREEWGLGQRPIKNVVHLLEAHGIRVFSLAEECREVDAFSCWRGEIPYVFLSTTKTVEHSRMDAAHELGHLVLHVHGGPRGRQQEMEAHAFGAALLMPESTILAEIPRGASLKQLIAKKARWKVSALNLARRSYKLKLLTEWQYRSICIELSKRGKANEPNPIKVRETSQILDKAFRAMRTEGVTKAAIAGQLNVPVDEINESVFRLILSPIEGESQAEDASESKPRPKLTLV